MEENVQYILKKLEENSSKIESNLEKIQKNSYAIEILTDYKQGSKRLYNINQKLLIIIFALLVIIVLLGIYLIVGG